VYATPRLAALVTATSFATIIGLASSSLSFPVRWMRSDLGEKLDNLAKVALSAINNLSDNARVRLKQHRQCNLFGLCLLAICGQRRPSFRRRRASVAWEHPQNRAPPTPRRIGEGWRVLPDVGQSRCVSASIVLILVRGLTTQIYGGDTYMTALLALSLSVGILGGIWALIALWPLAG
jgi:hypothetical protein